MYIVKRYYKKDDTKKLIDKGLEPIMEKNMEK